MTTETRCGEGAEVSVSTRHTLSAVREAPALPEGEPHDGSARARSGDLLEAGGEEHRQGAVVEVGARGLPAAGSDVDGVALERVRSGVTRGGDRGLQQGRTDTAAPLADLDDEARHRPDPGVVDVAADDLEQCPASTQPRVGGARPDLHPSD